MVFITSKNGIYACKNVVETCRKHGDMILRYLLIKTAAKFLRTEVIAKSRARHVHVMLLNVRTSLKVHLFNYSISQVSYMFTRLGLPMSRYTFVYFRKPKRFRVQMPTSTSRESLKDISYDQNFFAKICRRNLTHTHTHTPRSSDAL